MAETRPKLPLAAALRYDPDSGRLPVVVANGQGSMAERIRALALQHGVAVREDPPLAAMLAAVDADSDIPAEAMLAVAQVLAAIYRADRKFRDKFGPR